MGVVEFEDDRRAAHRVAAGQGGARAAGRLRRGGRRRGGAGPRATRWCSCRSRRRGAAGRRAAAAVAVGARCCSEEIDELRGRLRRAAEDRAALDAEVGKLRRGAGRGGRVGRQPDAQDGRGDGGDGRASVRAGCALTAEARGSAELLAARVTRSIALRVRLAEARRAPRPPSSGWRRSAARGARAADGAGGRARAAAAGRQRAGARAARRGAVRGGGARRRPSTRAALAERDHGDRRARRTDRASSRGEKQDLVWRLAELEDKLTDAIARAVRAARTRAPSGNGRAARARTRRAGRQRPPQAGRDAVRASARSVEFHKAAPAHVDELTELKASVAEQSALVAELEDARAGGGGARDEAARRRGGAAQDREGSGRGGPQPAVAAGRAGRKAPAPRARTQARRPAAQGGDGAEASPGGSGAPSCRPLAPAPTICGASSPTRARRGSTSIGAARRARAAAQQPPGGNGHGKPAAAAIDTRPARAGRDREPAGEHDRQLPPARRAPARRAGRHPPPPRGAVVVRDRRLTSKSWATIWRSSSGEQRRDAGAHAPQLGWTGGARGDRRAGRHRRRGV